MSLWGKVGGDGAEVKIPVIGVSGEKGQGKTLWISSIDPKGTCMIDLEGSSITYNLPFKQRHDLYEIMLEKHGGDVPKPIQCFEWFYALARSIKPGEFTVLAVDPITDIEQGMVDWVKANPARFGRSANQYEKAGGLLWADVNAFWKHLIGILSSKVETFAFTAHMRYVWKGSTPTERREAKGKSVLFEIASLYLHLERKTEKGNTPAMPVGMCAHPVGKSRVSAAIVDPDSGEVKVVQLLPPAFANCSPARIRAYVKNPPDLTKPKKDEKFHPPELTEDDRLEMKSQIAADERAAAEAKLSQAELLKQGAQARAAQKPAGAPAEKTAAPAAQKESATPAVAPTEKPTETEPFSREKAMGYIKACWASSETSMEGARAMIDEVAHKPGVKLAELTDKQLDQLTKKVVPF